LTRQSFIETLYIHTDYLNNLGLVWLVFQFSISIFSIQQDMPPKRVIKTLSIQDKFNLIKDVDSGFKKKDIAIRYGVPKSTVSTILKNKERVIKAIKEGTVSQNCKRLKKGTFENVDRAVVDWFKATRSQNILVSGALIKEKVLELAGRLRENISI
jgi:predicted nucleotidyltransferase